MRDPERLTREAFEEVAGDRFLGRVADRMHQTVEAWPSFSEVGEQGGDLRVVCHVAVEQEAGAELRCESGDAFLETLALETEGQLRALTVAGAGYSVGDRAVREHAGDEEALAG